MINWCNALVDNFHVQRFARFVLAGVANTIFGYAVYGLLIVAGLSAQPALAIAFVLGVIWNYFTTARFVFGQRGFRRLPAYIACYLVVYGANAAMLQVTLRAGLPPLLAQAALLPFVAVLAYALISYALTGRLLR